MAHLLTAMERRNLRSIRLYSFFREQTRPRRARFDELAAELERFLREEIPGGDEIVRTPQFIVVQKLCSIRHLQFLRQIPMGVISEYVDLDLGHDCMV